MNRKIILVLFTLIVTSVLGYFLLWSNKPQAQPSTSIPTQAENWKTYRNEKYGFEFKYPPDLTQQKRSSAEWEIYWDGKLNGISYVLTSGYISQDSLNAMGITYCGAHPEDPRCENFTWDTLGASIDWNIETEGAYTQSAAEIGNPDGGAAVISIYHPPSLEIKALFRQILSTFKFTKLD